MPSGPPNASGAIPIIDQRMTEFNTATQAKAHYALCRLRGTPKDVDGLVKLLESPDTDPVSQRAKRASAYYLLLLGPPAKEAVPKVQKMLPEGKHKQRVTDLLHGFIRKAAE